MKVVHSSSRPRRRAISVALTAVLSCAALFLTGPADATQHNGPDPGTVPCTAQPRMWLDGGYVKARMVVSCRRGAVDAANAINAQVILQNENGNRPVAYSNFDASTCGKSAGVALYKCKGSVAKLPNPGGTQRFTAMYSGSSGTQYILNRGGSMWGQVDGNRFACVFPKYKDYISCPIVKRSY